MLPDRFWTKVVKTSTCWLWTGARNNMGYGLFHVRRVEGKAIVRLAHRLAYEDLVEPIPEGLTLDHVRARGCTSTLCVNPAHLEPVTQRINIRRGSSPAAVAAAKTHCSANHPFDSENTIIDTRGYRVCRTCRAVRNREADKRRQQRRKIAA